MTLKEYFQLISFTNTSANQRLYLIELGRNFIRKPHFKKEIKDDIDDKYNPFTKPNKVTGEQPVDATYRGYVNGNKQLPTHTAENLVKLYNKDKFVKYLKYKARGTNINYIYRELEIHGFELGHNDEGDEDIFVTLADLLCKIFSDISNGNHDTLPPLYEDNGIYLREVAFQRVYVEDNILYINREPYTLPDEIKLGSIPNEYDLPYVNELLKVFSQKLCIPISSVEELTGFNRKIFEAHRLYYYDGESTIRRIESTFKDGENELDKLLTLLSDQIDLQLTTLLGKTGEERLEKTMAYATSIDMSSSLILKVPGLLKDSAKRGFCHILMNQGRIQAWVIETV